MARPYRLTPKRAAALKKAQIASARKRKGTGRKKPVAKGRYRRVQANATAAKRRVVKRVNRATNTPAKRRKIYRRVAIATASVAAVGGAAYTYKNREKLIVEPQAIRGAVKIAKIKARNDGRKLSKADIKRVKQQEIKDHRNRSMLRVREYRQARHIAIEMAAFGRKKGIGPLNIRPATSVSKKGEFKKIEGDWAKKSVHTFAPNVYSDFHQHYNFMAYRRDVYSRAVQRQNKIYKKGLSVTSRQGSIDKILQRRAIKNAKTRTFGYKSGKVLKVSAKGKVKRAWW